MLRPAEPRPARGVIAQAAVGGGLDFTAQAKEFASSVEGVVLMDGLRLVGLMIDNDVGVTSRLLRVPKLDSDYFDET